MGRVQSAIRNMVFGQVGNLMTQLLNFVLRTIFIAHLGDTLNGVNALYTGILSVLSMAELGIGTALNYSLYKPVAAKDYEKIKSYMQLYKNAYRIIGITIAIFGIALSPFLPWLVKQPQGITVRDLTLYYYIFLFNTVSSYFVAYKYSLVNAEQKNYIQTNILTVTKMITVSLQIVVILTTGNFYAYLLTAAGVELIQKIFVSIYLNKRYPYLKERRIEKLSRAETGQIVSKTKALVLQKVGDVARLQTDSMIISAFVNVTVGGFVDNYKMVTNSVANVVNIFFDSVLSGFGNLIATESKDKQYQMFKVYRFAACWLYGFTAMGFFMLLTPFIVIWLGADKVLSVATVVCLLLDYYFRGERVVLSIFKTAAGVFEQDQYVTLIQGIVNLIISITLVQKLGVVGVYVGTLISGLIGNVTMPIVVYKYILDRPVKEYFVNFVKYRGVMLLTFMILAVIKNYVMPDVTIISFAVMFVITCVVYNLIYLLAFGRTKEFGYLHGIVMEKIRK